MEHALRTKTNVIWIMADVCVSGTWPPQFWPFNLHAFPTFHIRLIDKNTNLLHSEMIKPHLIQHGYGLNTVLSADAVFDWIETLINLLLMIMISWLMITPHTNIRMKMLIPAPTCNEQEKKTQNEPRNNK